MERVTSSGGRAARDHLIDAALSNGWDVQLRGGADSEPGTYVTHVQFRSSPGQRPYPMSLILNPKVPIAYVRRPGDNVAELLTSFARAHHLNGEIQIPVPDLTTAKKLAGRLFR